MKYLRSYKLFESVVSWDRVVKDTIIDICCDVTDDDEFVISFIPRYTEVSFFIKRKNSHPFHINEVIDTTNRIKDFLGDKFVRMGGYFGNRTLNEEELTSSKTSYIIINWKK